METKRKNATAVETLCKKEREFLSKLFWQWKSEKGIKARKAVSCRDCDFEHKEKRSEYYVTFFLSLKDDVQRLGGDLYPSQWFWFDDPLILCDLLRDMLGGDTYESEKTAIKMFANAMCTLEGDLAPGRRYDADTVSRTTVLHLVCERMIAEYRLYGCDHAVTHAMVKADLAKTADVELANGGFQGVDYRNALDSYLAYSLYRTLKALC